MPLNLSCKACIFAYVLLLVLHIHALLPPSLSRKTSGKCTFKKHFVNISTSHSSGSKVSNKNDGARCLDGSTPAFYISRPAVATNKWILYFESGGWCYNEKACLERSLTILGSSSRLPECMDEGLIEKIGYISANSHSNLVAHDWNKVFINYCDGGSWSGNSQSEYNGKQLYYRGLSNRIGVIRTLLLQHGLNSADTVVVSGKSAGSLAVFVAIDHISDMIREVNKAGGVRIFGLADSGFFLKYDSLYRSTGMTFTNGSHQYVGYVDLNSKKYAEEIDSTTFRNTYATKMKAIYKMMNLKTGLPQSCIIELDKKDSGECIFAENLMKYIKTPTFLLQPVYDSWQLKHVLGSLPVSSTEDIPNGKDSKTITQFGLKLTQVLTDILQGEGKLHAPVGVFFDYCSHHGFTSDQFSLVRGVVLTSKDSPPMRLNLNKNGNKRRGGNGGNQVIGEGDHTANTAFYAWYQSMVRTGRGSSIGTSDNSGANTAVETSRQTQQHLRNEAYPCMSCCI